MGRRIFSSIQTVSLGAEKYRHPRRTRGHQTDRRSSYSSASAECKALERRRVPAFAPAAMQIAAIVIAKLPKRDVDHQIFLSQQSLKSILPDGMGCVNWRHLDRVELPNPPEERIMDETTKCPVAGGKRAHRNRDWWPNQLDLGVLLPALSCAAAWWHDQSPRLAISSQFEKGGQ